MSKRSVALSVGAGCLVAVAVVATGAAPPPSPQPVSVVNFPATQSVSGTVQVGNLPTVQTVAGTVQVGNLPGVQEVNGTVTVDNLPLDQDGNVAVGGTLSCAPSTIRYVGITESTFTYNLTLYAWSRACAAEFPGTRVCEVLEIARSIPPPEEWATGGVLAIEANADPSGRTIMDNACVQNSGVEDCNNLPPTLPIACCGY